MPMSCQPTYPSSASPAATRPAPSQNVTRRRPRDCPPIPRSSLTGWISVPRLDSGRWPHPARAPPAACRTSRRRSSRRCPRWPCAPARSTSARGSPTWTGQPAVVEAAVEALRAGRNQYAPGPGVPELRAAVAAHQARHYGIELDPETQVVVTAGATEAIAAALLALVDPGDEVVVLEPFYDSYVACIEMAGGVRRPVTLRAPGVPPRPRRAPRRRHRPHQADPAELARTTRPARCSPARSSLRWRGWPSSTTRWW